MTTTQRLRALAPAILLFATSAFSAPVHLVDEPPASITRLDSGATLVDFGRVAFGNIRLLPQSNGDHSLAVHFGEDLKNGRVNRRPDGTVRYAKASVVLRGGETGVVAPAPDGRNTQTGAEHLPPAVLTPSEWGVVLPFRWVEIEGWPGALDEKHIVRQAAFASGWDDAAAAFECSDATLNRIWELCRYSIKATTFAGVYVDGDRERIPYEADAYLNQLSHYATDHDVRMARDTFDRLMKHPTWPTEWASHMIFMAYADYRHTGDTGWLAPRYDSLKPKLLLERARADGLLTSGPEQIKKGDIVDWPKAERDGFVFTSVNSVVNAFHVRSLQMMAEMAGAVGRTEDATTYTAMAARAHDAFQNTFFDSSRGAYRDGEGTGHMSQHASLFPLAFGLVPEKRISAVLDHVRSRGMACSVYAAQYLMEGLFMNGAGQHAIELMTAPTDRSWRHMVDSGATITWEAWDTKYKPNQDWNHAWGAAPANLLPRFVLGAEVSDPGWKRALVRPHPGGLDFAKGKIPTPMGPILVDWKNGASFQMDLRIPDGMTARLDLPASPGSKGVAINGVPVAAERDGGRWIVNHDVSGRVHIEVNQIEVTSNP
ncbi:MAG: family 78 glycoside hydrolase catalytic domain [Akkermansiaceae bacterium]|nr:family 78 glycoside hydrolase catalytic domain [Akkermansiaceae bacterium]MCP5546936.1 family 78 glycoside hydrolase catalytic domain [Akkermansiaceae bacterium]